MKPVNEKYLVETVKLKVFIFKGTYYLFIYLERLKDVRTVLATWIRLRPVRQGLWRQETHLPTHKAARCTSRTLNGQSRKSISCYFMYSMSSYALKNVERVPIGEGKVVAVRWEPIYLGRRERTSNFIFFNFFSFLTNAKQKFKSNCES